MSFSPCAEPLPLPTPTAALGTLRARGLRISTTRRTVVDALFAADQPETAEEIARRAGADLVIGLPLILLGTALPPALESTAEKAVGLVIILLAVRVLVRWLGRHRDEHRHRPLRTPREAFGIGLLHGLAGTGAVVLLLLAALPDPLEASAALAVFAPMSAVSMAACTSGFAWTLTRPAVLPVYRTVLMPALGAMGLVFGLWYVGLA